MAKFCINCGNKLEVGQSCSCRGAVLNPAENKISGFSNNNYDDSRNQSNGFALTSEPSIYNQHQQSNQNVDFEAVKGLANTILGYFLGFFKNAATISRQICENDSYTKSIVLLALQAIIGGLLIYTPMSAAQKSASRYSSISVVNTDYFFYSFIALVIFSAFLALLLMMYSKAFRLEVPFNKTLAIVAAGSIPCTIGWSVNLLLLIILGVGLFTSSFFVALSTALIFGSLIASYLIILLMIMAYAKGEESKAFYIVILSNISVIFLEIIFMWSYAASSIESLNRMF